MLIQILYPIAVAAIFFVIGILVLIGARKDPLPQAVPLTPQEQAAMRVGILLTRLVTDMGPDGRIVRAAGDEVGADGIADAITSVPCQLIVKMTDEQLRAHIVRSCRSMLSGHPYRATLN